MINTKGARSTINGRKISRFMQPSSLHPPTRSSSKNAQAAHEAHRPAKRYTNCRPTWDAWLSPPPARVAHIPRPAAARTARHILAASTAFSLAIFPSWCCTSSRLARSTSFGSLSASLRLTLQFRQWVASAGFSTLHIGQTIVANVRTPSGPFSKDADPLLPRVQDTEETQDPPHRPTPLVPWCETQQKVHQDLDGRWSRMGEVRSDDGRPGKPAAQVICLPLLRWRERSTSVFYHGPEEMSTLFSSKPPPSLPIQVTHRGCRVFRVANKQFQQCSREVMRGGCLDARLRKAQSVPIIHLDDGWAFSARTSLPIKIPYKLRQLA